MNLLFGNNNPQFVKPASQVLKESAGFDTVNGQLCFIFSSHEGKRGYGKQAIPVQDLDSCLSVLQSAVEDGVKKEDYEYTTPEIIQRSLIKGEDGSIRFKTQGDKGKKPTLCISEQDFADFVSTFEEILPLIKEKAEQLKSQ